jgi:hypothetical protein
MHRVARELAHQECGWKHSEGHGVVALDYEGIRHVGLDKMCLLMEVRMYGALRWSCADRNLKPLARLVETRLRTLRCAAAKAEAFLQRVQSMLQPLL